MPLTVFQQTVALLLSANRTEHDYLAGGAALHLKPNSIRYSNDLDYFCDSEKRVFDAFEQDCALLEKEGFHVGREVSLPGYIRCIVSRENTTKIEWAHDSAWRFMPVVKDALAGFCLHPVDLAINKCLALVGRDEPRDFLDTVVTHEQVLSLGAMCWAACGKDPGFTPQSLLELLKRRGKYQPDDFARLRLVAPVDLVYLKGQWRQALAEAESLVDGLPPDELGCLYYNVELDRFVAPTSDRTHVLAHYGRPGGVLPGIIG